MTTTVLDCSSSRRTCALHVRSGRLVVLTALALSGLACTSPQRMTFGTPDEAVSSLVDSLRKGDKARSRQILNLDSDQVLSSGDEVADRNDVKEFLRSYDEKHSFTTEADGSMTLLVGHADWPLPFPLMRENDRWWFDPDEGVSEIVARRIGRNELSVIQVCLAVVDAQREYAALNGGTYAAKFASDPGQKNGLYWPAAEGEPPSPLGPLAASATAEGYGGAKPAEGKPRPYHGYCFRILTSQGGHAPGGALDYSVNGRLTRGFAVVAYPADYEQSGIMSFIVNHDGAVYQKDLGADTERLATTMTSFDPGPDWKKVD